MSFKYKSLVSAIALSSTLLACGDTAVSSDDTTAATTAPVTAANDSSIAPQNQVTQKLDTAKQGVEGATKSFSASAASSLSSISSMLAPLSEIVSQGESGGVEVVNQPLVKAYKAFSSEYKTLATRSAVTEAESALNISAADMEALMMAYFDVESAVLDEANNTITLKLNSNVICDSDLECLTVANKVTLSIAAINENVGVITLMYGNSSPLQLAYEPSAMAVLVDLAELKTAMTALASDQGKDISSEFPSTFEGQAAAGMHVTASSVEVSTWIEKAISVGNGQNNITMAATDNLATVKLDASAKTIHMTADVNAINGALDSKDLRLDTEGEGLLNIAFAGGTADVLVDAHEKKVTVKDTGTEGSGLVMTLDNETLFEVTLAKLSATLDIANKYAQFDSALDMSLSVKGKKYSCDNEPFMAYRTMEIDATSGTSISNNTINGGTMNATLTEKNLDTNVIETETYSISDGDSLNALSVNISGTTRCTSAVVTPITAPILPTATVAPTVMPTAVF